MDLLTTFRMMYDKVALMYRSTPTTIPNEPITAQNAMLNCWDNKIKGKVNFMVRSTSIRWTTNVTLQLLSETYLSILVRKKKNYETQSSIFITVLQHWPAPVWGELYYIQNCQNIRILTFFFNSLEYFAQKWIGSNSFNEPEVWCSVNCSYKTYLKIYYLLNYKMYFQNFILKIFIR